jgi:hypothetical protein
VTAVTQVILLVMHDGKCAQHRDATRPLPRRPGGAEGRCQSQIGGEEAVLRFCVRLVNIFEYKEPPCAIRIILRTIGSSSKPKDW